ncbi:protein kinase [Pararoseomonas sp. SCSIO 73927]|uniref:serine/threonine-protein kinase n=1 Tax=Pararoseomonas sp. SCSIO 73927 TaxID=3114537 RepID=UPI0030CF3824
MSQALPPGFGDWTGDGKYELRGTLGAGAMGVVLDGFDRAIERRVAIKIVRKPAPDDAEAVEAAARFKREAQAAGRLSHPGIVGVYDYGEDEGTAWIVMEMVRGGTLKALIDREERLPVRETARIMGQVLTALAYAHGRGVIHRDIKPANVMLTEEGDAKLADFGIARIENSSMTQVGTLMGTLSYMAPEQLRGEALDARADIWAAGVMLYQLLTGEKPFSGNSSAVMHKVLNTEPPLPSALASVTQAMDAVVMRALAKRAEDRWPDARTFATALELAATAPAAPAAMEEPEDATRVVAPPRVIASSAPPAPARGGRPGWVLPVAGLGALAALGAGAFLLVPRGESPPPPAVTAAAPPAGQAPAPSAPTPPAQPPAVQAPPVTPPPSQPQAGAAPTLPGQVPPAAAPSGEPVGTPQAPAAQQPAPAPPAASPPAAQPSTPPVPPAPPAQTQTQPPGPSSVQSAPELPPARPTPTTPAPEPARPAQVQPGVQPGPEAPPAQQAAPPTAQASLVPAPRPDWRAVSAAAVAAAPCGLLSARVEENGFRLGGVLPRAEAEAVRQEIARRNLPSGAARLDLGTFDAPYCPLLSALRPALAAPGEGPEVALDGARPLRKGELLRFAVTLPGWATNLHVAYATSDGAVLRVEPGAAVAPGARIRIGDPRPGFPGWRIDEPYGTDLLFVVASEDRLFAPGAPAVEDQAAYARGFAAAVQIARATGRRIALIPVPVDTAP